MVVGFPLWQDVRWLQANYAMESLGNQDCSDLAAGLCKQFNLRVVQSASRSFIARCPDHGACTDVMAFAVAQTRRQLVIR